MSGRRDSNPRPIAWKAIALPTELLPLVKFSGSDSKFQIELQPILNLNNEIAIYLWGEQDSNL